MATASISFIFLIPALNLSECDAQKEFACSPVFGSSLSQCIPLAFVCDGVEQCLNGRDEADCCNNYCDDGVTCIQDDRDGILSREEHKGYIIFCTVYSSQSPLTKTYCHHSLI